MGKTLLSQLQQRMGTETGLACGLDEQRDDESIMDATA
jgi:hypothetical protein